MKSDGDKPKVGRGAILLGVRVGPAENDDINPDAEGWVYPGQGGMSVSPSVDALPPHRLPRRLRDAYPERFPDASGPNGMHCWSMGMGAFAEEQLTERLRLRLDPDDPKCHGFVEPDGKMKTADYEAALGATQDIWQRWEE